MVWLGERETKGNPHSHSSLFNWSFHLSRDLHSLLYPFPFHLPGPKASATYFKFLLQAQSLHNNQKTQWRTIVSIYCSSDCGLAGDRSESHYLLVGVSQYPPVLPDSSHGLLKSVPITATKLVFLKCTCHHATPFIMEPTDGFPLG